MSALPHTNRMLRNANTWRQQYDALRWLDLPRAVRLLEQERRGIHAETQYTYDLVDSMDPDMIALIQLRLAAIKRLRWRVAVADEDTAGFDAVLAAEQEAALRAVYERMPDLVASVADLAMASFRGFSVLQIRRDAEGVPAALYALDRWLFARDVMRGDWYWNPSAQTLAGSSLPEADRIGSDGLPREDFIVREVPLAVDRVALLCSVRSSTVEKDWDAWCEMYGLHPSIITEPPNAKETDRPLYDAAARAFSDGQGGTIPNGAAVTFPNSVSVVAPFKERAEYLTVKKVLAGTSGRLTMLAESGSGTLAGGAHQDTFDSLAEAEAAEISELLQRAIDAPFLAARFPSRPVLAYYELQPYRRRDPAAAADRVSKIAQYYEVDAAELSEEIGLSLKPRPAPAQPLPPSYGPPALNSRAPAALNSRGAASAPQAPQAAALAALSEARRIGLAPLAARLEAALEAPDGAAMEADLRAILADLPAIYRAAAEGAALEDAAAAVAQSLADAVGSGYAAEAAALGMPPAKETADV